jgi:glycine dehydrogenase
MSSTATQTVQLDLFALQDDKVFISRHIGPDADDTAAMLATINAPSMDALIEQTVPASIRRSDAMKLGTPMSEAAALAKLKTIANQNQVFTSCIGMGYYDTHTPNVILRNVLENPGWYTAYTPYQPEISQGRLEALLNYQQMVMDLTGMPLSNASLLDEATAAAEAMTLCKRVNSKNKSDVFFVADDCHPQTIAVVKTRAEPLGLKVIVGAANTAADHDVFGALLQYPGSYGDVNDWRDLIASAKSKHILTVMAVDLLSLVLLTPPAELGVDVVIGNSQRFGVPMGFGGPHAAFMATQDAYKRSVPGRIIGVSVDRHGNTALRMAMQTREQHIRREKATSNICTAQALLAIMASFYAVYHGADGLKRIARRVHRSTQILAAGLEQLGFTRRNKYFFDTLTINVDSKQAEIIQRAEAAQFNLRVIGSNQVGISLDETTSPEKLQTLLSIFAGDKTAPTVANLNQQITDAAIPTSLQRQSDFLTHPVFNSYHSETEMLRYMKRLESRDIALNYSMIALGSCTMKLNATAEMIPVTWPEFAGLHPFAPKNQSKGYQQLTDELEAMLVTATGYDACSLQPNSGAQGEYAGLLAIQRYHQSRGDQHRTICLIPSSAHGTNPASAAMIGLKVVVVDCDAQGNVDLTDLRAKTAQHRDNLAAIMITYPSTHGVFEEAVTEICNIIHEAGGQVYVDGANLNALVGLAAPGKFGADVSHINLHKTFCIPHGGGGPGMGPIAVKSHLAPFLPNHPVAKIAGSIVEDTISAAPYGSASILPISWMYITLMGAEGLTRATKMAILNANYVAEKLKPFYPVLYTGSQGRVAHECIIDIRPLKEASGITEEDIAKRLMDYGFHAPTMSFPVPGTLMIEPTESESKAELDKFIGAMISIRQEISRVENNEWTLEDNPLRNAPHTAAIVTASEWPHKYSREQAAFPANYLREGKVWPTVGRIDNVYGDRNFVCSCPSIDSYRE